MFKLGSLIARIKAKEISDDELDVYGIGLAIEYVESRYSDQSVETKEALMEVLHTGFQLGVRHAEEIHGIRKDGALAKEGDGARHDVLKGDGAVVHVQHVKGSPGAP